MSTSESQSELANPPTPQNEAQRTQQERRLFRGIMLAILVWGSILSLGTFLFGIDHERGGIRLSPSPLRGAITLAFVFAFVIGWKVLLSRTRRT